MAATLRRPPVVLARRSYAGAMSTPATAERGRFAGLLSPSERDPLPVTDPAVQRGLRRETVLVLGVSLGSSAVYAVLSIIEKLTRPVPLSQQPTAMNQSADPGRPWLDLAFQLAGIVLPLVAVALAPCLLNHIRQPAVDVRAGHFVGLDRREPGRDLLRGLGLAAVIGIPGLGFYFLAKAIGDTAH